ncbi:MAG: arsenate reductase family protein [Bacillaceae bacterium]
MSITMYWYPKCGTCQKAKKWLEANELAYKAIHIVEAPPSKEEIKALHEKSELELKKFFNTSGQKYRQLGLKDKVSTMSNEEIYELLASDGMLIKRPILTDGKRVTVGFNEKTFEQTWVQA